MLAITRDGYIKRSSLKSHKASDGALPGIKTGDILVAIHLNYLSVVNHILLVLFYIYIFGIWRLYFN